VNNYKFAYPVIDFDSKEELKKLIIILDKKMQLEYNNGILVNLNLMINSKQIFESLKLKYTFD